MALRSGLRAASAVAAALRSGNPAAALAAYAREHGQDLRRRRALAAVMATLVDRPWLARRVARNLERNSGLRAALMRAISGSDEARSLGPLVLARMVA
ncbi:MAG: hypothetical protein JOZ38_01870 [Candidatus Eremiobacteraeota bacterium]|nr:hypothetical protein [Candidatus Eremiobacteraeota bacterium]